MQTVAGPERIHNLLPRLAGRKEMYSTRLIELHFWLTTLGVVLYIAAMWVAGVMQGLMWRATDEHGILVYSFIESLNATYPFYGVRLLGGVLYLSGILVMAYNSYKTLRGVPAIDLPKEDITPTQAKKTAEARA